MVRVAIQGCMRNAASMEALIGVTHLSVLSPSQGWLRFAIHLHMEGLYGTCRAEAHQACVGSVCSIEAFEIYQCGLCKRCGESAPKV